MTQNTTDADREIAARIVAAYDDQNAQEQMIMQALADQREQLTRSAVPSALEQLAQAVLDGRVYLEANDTWSNGERSGTSTAVYVQPLPPEEKV